MTRSPMMALPLSLAHHHRAKMLPLNIAFQGPCQDVLPPQHLGLA